MHSSTAARKLIQQSEAAVLSQSSQADQLIGLSYQKTLQISMLNSHSMPSLYNRVAGQSVNRLPVFAVAMTLRVLDLRAQTHLPDD